MADWVIAGKPQGSTPIVGRVYEVKHTRKGSFRARVDAVHGEWASCTVVEGIARAVMQYNVKYEGETVEVRDVLSYWVELETGESTR